MKACVIVLCACLAGCAQHRHLHSDNDEPTSNIPTVLSDLSDSYTDPMRKPECRPVRALDGRIACKAPNISPESDQQAAQSSPPIAKPAAGQYVVIGSFAKLANAERWASFNADFGAEIQRVSTAQPPVYRVVVGPLAHNAAGIMREIMSSVGVAGTWQLAVCPGSDPHPGAGCSPLLASAAATH